MCAYTCACLQELGQMVLLRCHSPWFSKRGLPFTGLEITKQAKLAGQRAFRISLVSTCVTLVLQVYHHMWLLYFGSRDQIQVHILARQALYQMSSHLLTAPQCWNKLEGPDIWQHVTESDSRRQVWSSEGGMLFFWFEEGEQRVSHTSLAGEDNKKGSLLGDLTSNACILKQVTLSLVLGSLSLSEETPEHPHSTCSWCGLNCTVCRCRKNWRTASPPRNRAHSPSACCTSWSKCFLTI